MRSRLPRRAGAGQRPNGSHRGTETQRTEEKESPMKRAWLGMAALMGIGASTAGDAAELPKVLFLTHSAGWKHSVVLRSPDGSLSWAEKQLQRAAKGRIEVVATQDLGELTREKLKGYQGVVFYTTGELDIDKEALIEFVRNGEIGRASCRER